VIDFTDTAKEHVVAFLREEEDDLAVRIEVVDSSPLAPRYDLALVGRDEREPDDRVVDLGDFEVLIDAESAPFLEGATVDWVQTLQGSGFKVENPNIKPLGSEPPSGDLADRVKHALEHQVNPAIASHGGRARLFDVRDGVVFVELEGGCQGCGMAAVTLTQGIKRILMETVPGVRDVQDVTNHAAGVNPYY
jgi:Fe/S biogenesis protein NfuA